MMNKRGGWVVSLERQRRARKETAHGIEIKAQSERQQRMVNRERV